MFDQAPAARVDAAWQTVARKRQVLTALKKWLTGKRRCSPQANPVRSEAFYRDDSTTYMTIDIPSRNQDRSSASHARFSMLKAIFA
jgi:hypothetical protein